MDPLNILHEEILDEIFSYLAVRDIKEASLVSKHWYNTIGQSSMCMKKISIIQPKRNQLTYACLEFIECIMNSNRQYQLLEFYIDESMVNKNTKYLRSMRDVVSKFSQSLVTIKISHDLKLRVDLPKLKDLIFRSLMFTPVNLIASNGLITKAVNLKTLKINCTHLDKKSLKYLKDALIDNKSLKILDIRNVNILKELNQNDMKLKLEQFYLTSNFRIDNKSVIQSFLNTQASSLQVTTSFFNKQCITYYMSNFPNLHTIIIMNDPNRTYNHFKTNEPDYPLNHKITKINCTISFYSDEGEILHMSAIIAKLPNFQELQIDYLTPELLPYLYNCQSLKVVKYKSLRYNFPQLQRDEIAQHERITFIQVRYHDEWY